MEHDIPFGNSNRENGPTFLDFPLFLGIFQWDEPTKRVSFTAEPKIPKILSKWKAPKNSTIILWHTPLYCQGCQPPASSNIEIWWRRDDKWCHNDVFLPLPQRDRSAKIEHAIYTSSRLDQTSSVFESRTYYLTQRKREILSGLDEPILPALK